MEGRDGEAVQSLARSDDGRWVAVALGDETIRLYAVGRDTEGGRWAAHAQAALWVAFGPVGAGRALGAEDGTANI